MNMNQLLNMIMRMFVRKAVNKGINAGINKAGQMRKPKATPPPEQNQGGGLTKEQVRAQRRARREARQARDS
jgi:hypothetical protein